MATKNLVPRADNEGQLGTAAKKWAKVIAIDLTLGTQAVSQAGKDLIDDTTVAAMLATLGAPPIVHVHGADALVRFGGTASALTVFGDSITTGYGLSSPSTENWAALLAARNGWTLTNGGVSGYGVFDLYASILAESVAAGKTYGLLCGINDAAMYGANSNLKTMWKSAMQSVASYLSIPATRKKMGTSMTTTGTWSTGGTRIYTFTPGATATATVVGKTVYVGSVIRHSYTGQFTVTVDGVVYGPYNAGIADDCTSMNGLDYGPQVVRIAGLPDGPHTVVVTKIDGGTGGGSEIYVDWIGGSGGAEDNGFGGCYVSTFPRSTAGGNRADVIVMAYNDLLRTAINELWIDGLPVYLVDACAYVLPATDLQVDGIHPNATGQQHICDAFPYPTVTKAQLDAITARLVALEA